MSAFVVAVQPPKIDVVNKDNIASAIVALANKYDKNVVSQSTAAAAQADIANLESYQSDADAEHARIEEILASSARPAFDVLDGTKRSAKDAAAIIAAKITAFEKGIKSDRITAIEAEIVKAVSGFDNPPQIYIREKWLDKRMSMASVIEAIQVDVDHVANGGKLDEPDADTVVVDVKESAPERVMNIAVFFDGIGERSVDALRDDLRALKAKYGCAIKMKLEVPHAGAVL